MMNFLIGALQLDGQPTPPAGTTGFIAYNGVQRDYFRAMGVRLREGTTFTDTTDKSIEVMVNEGFVKKYLVAESR